MMTAMIDGIPNTNAIATAAEPNMPVTALSACSAYIQCV
jgi:hypothetical protein